MDVRGLDSGKFTRRPLNKNGQLTVGGWRNLVHYQSKLVHGDAQDKQTERAVSFCLRVFEIDISKKVNGKRTTPVYRSDLEHLINALMGHFIPNALLNSITNNNFRIFKSLTEHRIENFKERFENIFKTPAENVHPTYIEATKVIAGCFTGWDYEIFGLDYSKDNMARYNLAVSPMSKYIFDEVGYNIVHTKEQYKRYLDYWELVYKSYSGNITYNGIGNNIMYGAFYDLLIFPKDIDTIDEPVQVTDRHELNFTTLQDILIYTENIVTALNKNRMAGWTDIKPEYGIVIFMKLTGMARPTLKTLKVPGLAEINITHKKMHYEYDDGYIDLYGKETSILDDIGMTREDIKTKAGKPDLEISGDDVRGVKAEVDMYWFTLCQEMIKKKRADWKKKLEEWT